MISKIANFTKRAVTAAAKSVVGFAVGVARHAETITVLSLSAIGANVLIGELPFYMAMPMWIEATLVVPVLAVLIVSFLIKSGEFRARRRGAQVVYA